MSDGKITLTKRMVKRGEDQLYRVVAWVDGKYCLAESKGYAHSTSAYAKLGRLTQQETQSVS